MSSKSTLKIAFLHVEREHQKGVTALDMVVELRAWKTCHATTCRIGAGTNEDFKERIFALVESSYTVKTSYKSQMNVKTFLHNTALST